MSPDAATLEASYARCRQVAKGSGSNFYRAFGLLGPEKRRAMDALYAFMRHTDDLGDGDQPLAARRAALDHWRAEVTAALAGETAQTEPDHEPNVLPALADTVARFQIPAEHLLAVLDGVQMDLDGVRYETFEELAEYCRRVASAVGRACLPIWGIRGDGALAPADQCGLAFQLTNILRDLKEDAARGRIYLPLEELRRCDYSPDDLAAGVADERFVRLMRLQLQRAEQLYREGAAVYDWLYPDGQRIFGLMLSVYHALLQQIARQPTVVLQRRVSLGWLPKTRLTARWLLKPPRRLRLA